MTPPSRRRHSTTARAASALAEAMASDLPTTVIDFVDSRARFGYAAEGRAVGPMLVRSGTVREKTTTDAREVASIERSRVRCVDALECVVRDGAYDGLGWQLGMEGTVVACEASGATTATREWMTRMFFEEFNVAGLAFVDSAVCAVYASGRVSGVSVDVAEQGTDCACVTDGATATATARRIEVGGRAMDEALMRCVKKKQGVDLNADVASVIRRELGKCASTREEYQALARGCPTVECEQETFTMPDGSVLKLTNELYECGEAMMPIVDEICESVQKLAPEFRRYALDNVFVHGVASQVSGLDARLLHELTSSLPPSMAPIMTTVPEYMPPTTWSHAPWTGAALLAKVIFSSNQHISKTDYNENGPPVSNRGR